MLAIRLYFIFMLLPVAALTQSISVGLKGGLPLTNSTQSGQVSSHYSWDSNSKEYIVGGMAEIKLPLRLSIEGDGLFHPFNLRTNIFNLTSTSVATSNTNVFEFPILAKYRLGRGLAVPYVEGGPAFRNTPAGIASSIASGKISAAGVTLGAGIEFKALVVKLAPEIRYTRWGRGSLSASASGYIDQQNQAAVLIGVSF